MMILGDSRGGVLDLGGEDVFADFAHRAEAEALTSDDLLDRMLSTVAVVEIE